MAGRSIRHTRSTVTNIEMHQINPVSWAVIILSIAAIIFVIWAFV